MVQKLPKPPSLQIAPSLLSCDFARIADEIAEIAVCGTEMIHLDVMDGHFVPNITFGPPVVAKIRSHCDLFFDAHLMITDPEKYAQPFIDAGVDNITFHIEAVPSPGDFINRLHDCGISVGLCLNPETAVSEIERYAPLVDMVLVMTVHPGFGGQSFIAAAAEKIAPIRQLVGSGVRIEVDGGIDSVTAPLVTSYGADTLVAGNAIFGQADRRLAIESIRLACGQSE